MIMKRGEQAAHENEEHPAHADEEQAAHAGHEHSEENHFYIFEKVLVNKEITQGGFSSFTSDKNNIINKRFAINNAQALLSEMKKGGGHSGHAH